MRKIAILVHFLKLKCDHKIFTLWYKWHIYYVDCYLYKNQIIAIDKKCRTSLSCSIGKNFNTPKELIDLLNGVE